MRFLLFFFLLHLQNLFHLSLPQTLPPNTTGYACDLNQTAPSCQTYAFFRATPNQLDLASISDLFYLTRPMIAKPSNLTSLTSPLSPNQPLFIPLTCTCNSVNTTTNLSYAKINYTIKSGDTFYVVSTTLFHNLTTYQSVEIVNPTLVPTKLTIGQDATFPIFCKCPTKTQLQNNIKYLISYVFEPSDTISSIASRFRTTRNSIVEVNGNNNIKPSDTIFVPVSKLPVLAQPSPVSVSSDKKRDRRGEVIGLGIGVGVCGVMLVLMSGFWAYRELLWKKRVGKSKYDEESKKFEVGIGLMADVSDCLDKYKVYRIEELNEATNGFDERCVIQGSVFKGCIDGKWCAIKRMKWNACEELKILQKINHGNLVMLEGFCIDSDDANCYLVYEYLENGSLYTRLHGSKSERLSWRKRLRIAVDIANGLQYIHEHTIPRVVHKDIKSSNILLDAEMRAKIANFGLAKSGCNAITMHIVGTQGYIAPEYLADGVVSTKMDVFSFGVILLELVSGKEAIDEKGKALWVEVYAKFNGINEEKQKDMLKGFVDDVILEESCSMDSVMNVMSIATACLHKDPSRRPSMVDIVYALCKSDDLFTDLSEDGISPHRVLAR